MHRGWAFHPGCVWAESGVSGVVSDVGFGFSFSPSSLVGTSQKSASGQATLGEDRNLSANSSSHNRVQLTAKSDGRPSGNQDRKCLFSFPREIPAISRRPQRVGARLSSVCASRKVLVDRKCGLLLLQPDCGTRTHALLSGDTAIRTALLPYGNRNVGIPRLKPTSSFRDFAGISNIQQAFPLPV
jgi:hypothetical protein